MRKISPKEVLGNEENEFRLWNRLHEASRDCDHRLQSGGSNERGSSLWKKLCFGAIPVKCVLFILFLQQVFIEHFLCARHGSAYWKLIPEYKQTKISVLMELAFSGQWHWGRSFRIGRKPQGGVPGRIPK